LYDFYWNNFAATLNLPYTAAVSYPNDTLVHILAVTTMLMVVEQALQQQEY